MTSKQIKCLRKQKKNQKRLKNKNSLSKMNNWLVKNHDKVDKWAKESTLRLIGKESL